MACRASRYVGSRAVPQGVDTQRSRLPMDSSLARGPHAELLRYVLRRAEPRVAGLGRGHPTHTDSPLQTDLIAAQRAAAARSEGHGQARGGRGADREPGIAQAAVGEGIERDPLAELAGAEQAINSLVNCEVRPPLGEHAIERAICGRLHERVGHRHDLFCGVEWIEREGSIVRDTKSGVVSCSVKRTVESERERLVGITSHRVEFVQRSKGARLVDPENSSATGSAALHRSPIHVTVAAYGQWRNRIRTVWSGEHVQDRKVARVVEPEDVAGQEDVDARWLSRTVDQTVTA